MMHNKIEIKMENYYAKLTQFNKFIPLLLRSEDLSKMEQDELNIFLLKYVPNGW